MDISSKHGTALIFIIVDFEVDFGTYGANSQQSQ
jgi:hypothetical protein